MKSNINGRSLLTGLCACGILAWASSAALADAGRGSIRAAGRAVPAPHEVARPEPVHAEPARVEPAHEEPPRVEPPRVEPAHVEPAHVESPHEVPDRRGPDIHHDVPAPPPARRDWDDHDDDSRHFGGFAHGVPIHIPRGQRFHDLPPRHFDIPWHNQHWFFDPVGAFYLMQSDGEYLCVQPPAGIPITALPDGAEPITVGPTTYYYLDGIFYVAQANGFTVVDPPPGIVVSMLPDGASQTLINDVVIYQFDGFNYTPAIVDGVTEYTVTPS